MISKGQRAKENFRRISRKAEGKENSNAVVSEINQERDMQLGRHVTISLTPALLRLGPVPDSYKRAG